MCLYGVYSDCTDDLHEHSDCVGVKRYIVEMGAKEIFIRHKHIPVDAKFYAESEFEVKKNFPPTHFREN